MNTALNQLRVRVARWLSMGGTATKLFFRIRVVDSALYGGAGDRVCQESPSAQLDHARHHDVLGAMSGRADVSLRSHASAIVGFRGKREAWSGRHAGPSAATRWPQAPLLLAVSGGNCALGRSVSITFVIRTEPTGWRLQIVGDSARRRLGEAAYQRHAIFMCLVDSDIALPFRVRPAFSPLGMRRRPPC